MSNGSYSFSRSYTFGQSSAETGPCYIAPPFDARVVEEGMALVLLNGGARFLRLPLQMVRLLGQCSCFRSLDEHTRHAVSSLGVPSAQAGAVRQSLEELVRLGLLQPPGAILDRLKAGSDDSGDDAGISTLFVRTCERPRTLARLLDSLVASSPPDSLKHCIVLDDSRDAQSRHATRAVVEVHQSRLGGRLQIIDRDQRRAVLGRLAGDAGVSEALLLWTIEGSMDDAAPSYGANLNFALLLGAGTRMALMDDDATLQAWSFPGCRPQPVMRRRQSAHVEFPDPDREMPAGSYHRPETHPLQQHADLLGTGMEGLIARAGGDAGALLADLDPQSLADIRPGSRVRLTSSGVWGDPGTCSMHWIFTESAARLKPLCEDEQRYQALVGQRRLARSALQPAATTVFGLMTSTLTGIDNRDLLMPTQPRGGNEDLLFGALTDYLYPGTLQVDLPHMLYHMRLEARRWDTTNFRPSVLTRGSFVSARVNSLSGQVTSADVDSRIAILAETCRNLAREARGSLLWQLNRELLQRRHIRVEKISATRSELQPPPWLDRDFGHILEQYGRVSEADESAIAGLAESLPVFLSHYADALPHWVRCWRYCRSLGTAALLAQAVEEQPATAH